MMKPHALGWVAAFSLVAACGTTVHQPSRFASFEPAPAFELNDEDVAKAFDARPQLAEQLHLAYYSFDANKAEELGALADGLPTVEGTYRVPSLMMTGERRFADVNPWYAPPPPPFSVKKLRLLAAQAHCDAVVVFDYGYHVASTANALAIFDILLVPALFVPFLNVTVESYLDAYLIDTRNGYLYGHVTADVKEEETLVTIWTADATDMVEAQWEQLKVDAKAKLVGLLSDPELRAGATPAGEVEAEPAPEPEPEAPPAPLTEPAPLPEGALPVEDAPTEPAS